MRVVVVFVAVFALGALVLAHEGSDVEHENHNIHPLPSLEGLLKKLHLEKHVQRFTEQKWSVDYLIQHELNEEDYNGAGLLTNERSVLEKELRRLRVLHSDASNSNASDLADVSAESGVPVSHNSEVLASLSVFQNHPFDNKAALAVLGTHAIGTEQPAASSHALLKSLIEGRVIVNKVRSLTVSASTSGQPPAEAVNRYRAWYIHQLGEAVTLFNSGEAVQALALIDAHRSHFDRVLFELDLPASAVPSLFDAVWRGYNLLYSRWTEEELETLFDKVATIVKAASKDTLPDQPLLLAWATVKKNPKEAAQILEGAVDANSQRVQLLKGLVHYWTGYHLWRAGQLDQALVEYNKALEIRQSILGEKHAEVAEVYNDIGNVYYGQAKLNESLSSHLKALEIKRETLGEHHPETAQSYNNIGTVYFDQEDATQARDYFEKDLEISTLILGENHPEVASLYTNLATVLEASDHLPEALEYHLKAAHIRKTVFGEDDLITASSMQELGLTYRSLRKFKKAIFYLKKALDVRKAKLGEQHGDTATTINSLAWTYKMVGSNFLAMEYAQKASKILNKLYGSKHPETQTADMLVKLFKTLDAKGAEKLALPAAKLKLHA